MITGHDLWYLPRVKNLEEEYEKCVRKYKELTEDFNTYVELENADPFVLNVLAARKEDIMQLMMGLKNQIERLRLETLN